MKLLLGIICCMCYAFPLVHSRRLECTSTALNYDSESSLQECVTQHLNLYSAIPRILDSAEKFVFNIEEHLKSKFHEDVNTFLKATQHILPEEDETPLEFLERICNTLETEWENANNDPKFKAKRFLRERLSLLTGVVRILGLEKFEPLHTVLCLTNPWQYLAVLADFAEYELELRGYEKTGKLVGAVGNTLAGEMSEGIYGALEGVSVWGVGEIADEECLGCLEAYSDEKCLGCLETYLDGLNLT